MFRSSELLLSQPSCNKSKAEGRDSGTTDSILEIMALAASETQSGNLISPLLIFMKRSLSLCPPKGKYPLKIANISIPIAQIFTGGPQCSFL